MGYSRREFLQLLSAACAAGILTPGSAMAARGSKLNIESLKTTRELYDIPVSGNVSLMHFTDSHAQLMPTYYREPHIHLGFGENQHNQLPHIVGKYFLERFKIPHRTEKAYTLTFLDFPELANRYGKTGGFAHLATLVNKIRKSRPGALLLDGGDTWQGSATSLWTEGQDMIDAAKILGVDVMTGHWEFTYGMERIRHVLENDFKDKIDFVAQNIVDNEFEDPIFDPYVIKEMNGIPIAIIGQAFPYTPVSHPRRFVESWQFGIKEDTLQSYVNKARKQGAQLVVLLSHNGMDVDLKMASRITGLDIILGGHTHDAIPTAVEITNPNGKTIVTNSGANGKFLSVLDLNVKKGKLRSYKYHLLPVLANLLPPDPTMSEYIESVRKKFSSKLNETLAYTDDMLYRRGTFNGTFDQLILNSLMESTDAEIAFSPGFRWGTTILPNSTITMEDVMAQTAITYPYTTRNTMTGERIKFILEDLADNRFSHDPYHQQGGDMVRVGGLSYRLDPMAKLGSRIKSLMLNGKPVDARKTYVVAGWASMENINSGTAIWDVVANYLRDKKTISIHDVNMPHLPDLTGYESYQNPTA